MYSRKKWMKQLGLFRILGESSTYVCVAWLRRHFIICYLVRTILSVFIGNIERKFTCLYEALRKSWQKHAAREYEKCPSINLVENRRLFLFNQLKRAVTRRLGHATKNVGFEEINCFHLNFLCTCNYNYYLNIWYVKNNRSLWNKKMYASYTLYGQKRKS